MLLNHSSGARTLLIGLLLAAGTVACGANDDADVDADVDTDVTAGDAANDTDAAEDTTDANDDADASDDDVRDTAVDTLTDPAPDTPDDADVAVDPESDPTSDPEPDSVDSDVPVDVAMDSDVSVPPPEWPVFGGVEPLSAPIHTDMAAPGYLEWTVEPRSTAPHFTDDRVATEVARITDAATFGLSDSATFATSYAKVSPWNADNSLALVYYEDGGATLGILLDGQTLEYVRHAPALQSAGRWANSNPNVFYRPANGGEFHYEIVTVGRETSTVETFVDFSEQGYQARTSATLFGGEGNQSNDDRIWAFNMQRDDGQWEIVSWNAETRTILGSFEVPGPQGAGSTIDWWGVSQLGGFILTQTHTPWQLGDVTIPRGNNVWSLEGEYLRTNDVSLGHLDLCIDADGNDVLAFMGNKYEGNDKVLQTWRLDGADGSETVDHMPNGYIGWAYHMNCRNTARPGFVNLTSSLARPTSNYNVYPLWNQLSVVRLDGSGEVAVIGNSHHSEGGEAVNEYYRSPFGPSNRDLSAVLFQANWDTGDDGPVHLYVARPVAD